VTPTFTLIESEHQSSLGKAFVSGRSGLSRSNLDSYLEEVKTHIVKDYDGGHCGGFFIKIHHTKRNDITSRAEWSELPPFMRFKESVNIDIYGDSSITAGDIAKYIQKISEKFDFSQDRVALCIESENGLKPVFAANTAFLKRLKLQMEAYYSDYTFVISPYKLSASA
tara:strand:- start:5345 stop:5848 length:504 start_codon:yes stop_codon:yes gene_type:complete